jgi:hypothetical protein
LPLWILFLQTDVGWSTLNASALPAQRASEHGAAAGLGAGGEKAPSEAMRIMSAEMTHVKLCVY